MTDRPTEGAPPAGTPAGGAPGAPGATGTGPSEDRPVPEGSFDMDATALDGGDDINTEAANDEPVAPRADAEAGAGAAEDAESLAGEATEQHPDTVLAAERLADLQRLQAEYVNYKRRVDRDRAVVQERAVHDVLESLLPVLDDLHAAREHGDLVDGPFAAIADKLEATLGRYGLARYGAKGEEFDPQRHEALMHTPWPVEDVDLPGDATSTTVVTVLQPGYRAGEQVLRPARVAVADPD
ncbi:MAG TPA: nucleotide exchange factor GrpE [Phycicoccus sp.]|nr:nucleotide exchange factor GrpE [Phycicoccus sp.]